MEFLYEDIVLNVPENVYYPEDDSILLARYLEKQQLKNKNLLEVGCGSGFLSILAAKLGAHVKAVDISQDAIETITDNAELNDVEIEIKQSDLLQNVTGQYDIIIFNAPYLPADVDTKIIGDSEAVRAIYNDHRWAGGPTGREVIERFIAQASGHLNKDGKIFLLISSLTGEQEVLNIFRKHGFGAEVKHREKIPWEELLIIEAFFR